MTDIPNLRKAIKAEYPDLQFKIKTIDFSDLARCSAVYVESSAWGATKGGQEIYQKIKSIAKQYGALVSW